MRPIALALACTLPLLSVACVSTAQHDAVRRQVLTLQEQNVALQQEGDRLRQQLEDLRSRIAQMQATRDANAELAAQRQQELTSLQQQYSALQARLASLQGELTSALNSTPVVVRESVVQGQAANELEQLAAQYSDVMTFDAQTGMIRLKSDLTFALGSDEVSARASEALGRVAQVLNNAAAGYEIHVIGHTDNVPMRNPTNIQRYGNNWGLSTARARSVMQVLNRNNVAENRFMIAGYGEFRPVVANGTRGAEANRRVDIMLVNRQVDGAAAPAQPAAQPAAAPAATPSSDADPASFKA
jgi:chemotaxis protein MotB